MNSQFALSGKSALLHAASYLFSSRVFRPRTARQRRGEEVCPNFTVAEPPVFAAACVIARRGTSFEMPSFLIKSRAGRIPKLSEHISLLLAIVTESSQRLFPYVVPGLSLYISSTSSVARILVNSHKYGQHCEQFSHMALWTHRLYVVRRRKQAECTLAMFMEKLV